MQRPPWTILGLLLIVMAMSQGRTLAAHEERALRGITIVNISDWHAQLAPVSVTIDGQEQLVGGAAVLKSYFDQERQRNPDGILVVTAGDAFGATPPLGALAKAITDVDVLLGDHTNVSVNTVMNGMIVTENRSKGAQYTVIDLTYDLHQQAIVSRAVVQKRPWVEGRSADRHVQTLLDRYQSQLQLLLDRKVGETALVLEDSRQEESLLGNLVTDILQRMYRAQLAFDVSGALRAGLPSAYQQADRELRRIGSDYAAGPPYDVVAGDFYSIFPFGNVAVTFKITGRTLWEALEQSVSRSISRGTKSSIRRGASHKCQASGITLIHTRLWGSESPLSRGLTAHRFSMITPSIRPSPEPLSTTAVTGTACLTMAVVRPAS